MQKWKGSADELASYLHILWVSYALANHNAFWEAFRELMRLYTSEELAIASSEYSNDVLPDRVLGERASYEIF